MAQQPPKPALNMTDAWMRYNPRLAAEIKSQAAAILLLHLEWMIRHLDNSTVFEDGKWWIITSPRRISKRWFYGKPNHDTIDKNLAKLEAAGYVCQKLGEKQGDKRKIALNPDGCRTLKSVIFEEQSALSENQTDDDKPSQKQAVLSEKQAGNTDAKSDSAVGKSDGHLEESFEESEKQENSSEEQHPPSPPIDPASNGAAAAAIGEVYDLYQNNIALVTAIIAEDIKDAIDEFSAQWVKDAITEAARGGGKSWNYIRAILERWQRDGRAAKRNGKNPSPGSAPPPPRDEHGFEVSEWFRLEDGKLIPDPDGLHDQDGNQRRLAPGDLEKFRWERKTNAQD